MKLLPSSIRWRIQIWHGVLLLLVLAGFGVTAYRLERSNAYRHLDRELELRTGALFSSLDRRPEDGPPPRDGRPQNFPGPPRPRQPPVFRLPADLAGLFASGDRPAFYYIVWGRMGGVLSRSENAPADVDLPARADGAVIVRARGELREAYQFSPPGECLLVGTTTALAERELAKFAGWLAALGGVVLVFGLAGGGWLAARAIAPIDDISATAARIAGGHLAERIDIAETESELGQLAALLNDTFARLEAAFMEQARFTSDAAHELRTPVSIILAQTQLALARPRSAEDYRETVEIAQRAARRMHSLIESLLALARLDADAQPLHRQPCDLADLARENLDLIRPLADERGIILHSALAPAPCAADADRVGQILTNLLSNAVKYSRPGDQIRLATSRENGCALVSIADTGPGIAAEHLPHLFERFYRVDASRNRATGGAGLGLAICRTLAESHGGTLAVESEVEKGSTFTLRIPVHETLAA